MFQKEILLLFKTVRKFGGSLSNSKLVANFTSKVDGFMESRLKEIGAEVRVVEVVEPRSPHSNKIMNLSVDPECDILVALDTDTAIARDFAGQLNPNYFQAKPVDHDPLTIEQWHILFSAFNLPLPTIRYQTSFFLKETIPYFNSGVIAVPMKYVKRLRDAWSSFVISLFRIYPDLDHIANHKFFTDQFALSLALVKEQIPVEPFGLAMNFPTHHPIHSSLFPKDIDPFILHYHHRIDAIGDIMVTGYSAADEAIRKINTLSKSNY